MAAMVEPVASQPRLIPALLAVVALLLLPPIPQAQTAATAVPIVIDASSPPSPPASPNYTYVASEAQSPSGHILGLNSQYLTLDGKPWLPVMGEMHYSRVPESEWETEILKMKSAGVQIIATYLIWIHDEEIEGQWDWSGQKDLRRFVQLCGKHNMYVVPRIGPWSHAEVRNGGFPDWLLAKAPNVRSNDPTYLHYVQLFYDQIGQQLRGLMWDEGGPVIAIQLENEYNRRGPLGGAPHILKLKELARDAGLRVPFYTVTGWDGGAMPHGAVLPVYGGYPDAPWDASIQPLPPSEVYAFRFNSRVTGDMGAIGDNPTGNAANFTIDTPFMTAEMGGGMQVTYHRRPVVSADDIAAMMPVMLGSGVNLYGTYMFHGGENPDGKLTTLQESLATHYANDLPVKTYDFEAPIGEFGQERPSLLKLKTWNYFLNDFGDILAPMQPHAPSVLPTRPADLSVPRVAARTSGDSGFLFVSNHVRGSHMPARKSFQVTIKLRNNESITLPEHPVVLDPDAYFAWPFNLDLSGLHLRYATAQPFAILGTAEAPVYAFVSQSNIPTDLVLDETPGVAAPFSARTKASQPNEASASGRSGTSSGTNYALLKGTASAMPQTTTQPNAALAAEGNGCSTAPEHRGHTVIFRNLKSGPDCMLRFSIDGHRVSILVLSPLDAEHSWRIFAGPITQLLVASPGTYVDRDSAVIQSNSDGVTSACLVIPAMGHLIAADSGVQLEHFKPLGDCYVASSIRKSVVQPITAHQSHPASDPAPLPDKFKPSSRPRVVAAAPTDADWSRAATWNLTVPEAPVPHSSATRMNGKQQPRSNQHQFLRLRYTGDVARLSAGGHLLTDDFYTGQPWLIGLDRFQPQLAASHNQLQLSIYPLRPNPPIFFEPGTPTPSGAHLESVQLVTQYSLRLKLVPAGKH
jgi:beta-galactosidase